MKTKTKLAILGLIFIGVLAVYSLKPKTVQLEIKHKATEEQSCVRASYPLPVVSKIEAVFTSYNAEANQTDASPFIMASGNKVYEGAIACPIKYNLGTRIAIEGLGIFTCEDRMAKRFREQEHFDIFHWSKEDNVTRVLSYEVLGAMEL